MKRNTAMNNTTNETKTLKDLALVNKGTLENNRQVEPGKKEKTNLFANKPNPMALACMMDF